MPAPPEDLAALPPSAKLVYKVLEYEGALTQQALCAETLLPARTVRYALDRLEGAGLVTPEVYLADARQTLYSPVSA
jgi:hypothetical protein